MNEVQILNALSPTVINDRMFTRIVDSRRSLHMSEALVLLHLALPISQSRSELDAYAQRIEAQMDELDYASIKKFRQAFENLVATAHTEKSDSTNREDRTHPLQAAYEFSQTPHAALPADRVLHLLQEMNRSESKLSVPVTRYVGENIEGDPMYERPTKKDTKLADQHRQEFLKALSDGTSINWEKGHLYPINFYHDDVMVAWRLLRKLSGQIASLEQIYQIRANILQLFKQTREVQEPHSSNPSRKALRDFMLSMLNDIRVEK